MSRIEVTMASLASDKRKALIPYIVAGDPVQSQTVSLMHEMVKAGANIIELGVPFSDPMAEGPVIQLAHERALEHNTSLTDVMAMVAEFRQHDNVTPVVLMGYCNPVEVMGYERFANACHEAGVDGVLIVDMPPEEAKDLQAELKRHALDLIFLIAPTTTEARIQKIVSLATGYLYYVSLKGVTGAGHLDIDSVNQNIGIIRQYTTLPLCVGFGIKDGPSAKAISAQADGAVVGSVLVNTMAGGGDMAEINANVSSILADMRSHIDSDNN